MHRSNLLSLLAFALLAALLPVSLRADPLVLALPTSKSAYLGTSNANATFDVAATSTTNTTLSYQWEIKYANNSTVSNLTDNNTFNGSTTSNLTVSNLTDMTFNGDKFKCIITDTNNTTVTSSGGMLNVYATPTIPAPNVTLIPSSIAANDTTTNITINITGLPVGHSVRIQRFLDVVGGSPNVDILDPLVADHLVTDGQRATFGGVVDPVIPGDDDGVADGNITFHFILPAASEFGRASGNFIIKIASTTGDFTTITKTLTITQPTTAQNISGQVLNGSTPIPNALVGILTASGNNSQFVAGALSDNGGNYSINATAGSYQVVAFKSGYVASSAPSVTLSASSSNTGVNPGLVVATNMIGGSVEDSTNPTNSNLYLRGVQLIFQVNNGGIVITTTNNDGDYIAPVTADTWGFDISDNSLPSLGYLRPSNNHATVDTTAGNDFSFNISTEPVNALIYGTITNSSNVGISGVVMDAQDNVGNFEAKETTDSSGNYYLGVYGPPSGNISWFVSADSTNPVLNGLIPFSGNSFNVTVGSATQANFTAGNVTAHINGTVSNNSTGTPIAAGNLSIQADMQNNNGPDTVVTSTSDSNGNFSLGVFGGNWTVGLNYGDGNSTGLVSQSLSVPVTDGNNTNITLQVLNSTATISGNVVDQSNNPVTGQTITANATISSVNYSVNTQTDDGGNYILPVINGNWTVSISYSQPIFTNKTVTITGNGSQILNLTPSPFAVWQVANFPNNVLFQSNISGPNATPGNDGIPNLVKYAFNIPVFFNGQEVNGANLPPVTLSNGNLTLIFNASRSDVTYIVQASTDLVTWTTTGVTQSVPDGNGNVTATYSVSGHPTAFLRIQVTLND